MSSTKTVLAEGSSGRASAEPIISRVIPCYLKKFMKILKVDNVYVPMKKRNTKEHILHDSTGHKS
jgi:hypothetical protein